jgi:long-subunit fatty acid transport protein
MKLGGIAIGSSLLVCISLTHTHAGGLFLPGTGATSTSRAGASVASVDDGEALSINPAGLAKSNGTTLTISVAFIRYFMEFTRRGSYDASSNPDFQPAYTGDTYATVENDPEPPLGIGKFQPIPVIALSTDFKRIPNLRAAIGLYAPSGYPFRNMTQGYQFPTFADPADLNAPPPPTRYDTMRAESRALLPSIAASYRILPQLDIGARFTAGNLTSKQQLVVWGTPNNVEERVVEDSLFDVEISDGFIPAFGIGVAYRPIPQLEIAANYSSALVVKAKGEASSKKGPDVDQSRVVGPVPDEDSLCATGGTFEKQKACINLQLPQTATVGARYIFPGANDQIAGDIELNVAWENWGKKCERQDENGDAPGTFVDPECTSPGEFRVLVDGGLYVNNTYDPTQRLRQSINNYNLKDVYSVRLGGSYHLPLGDAPEANRVILRGGVAYDTQAANDGWFRAAMDGAARTTMTLGGAFRTKKWQLSIGGGYVHEGTNTNEGANDDGTDCNPTLATLACNGSNASRPLDQRKGPDPSNPLIDAAFQAENPYNQGSIKSHYILLMLGYTRWF